MFILYSVLIGLAMGFVVGGRLAGLADLRLRAGWLIAAALAVQVVLFSPLGTDGLGGTAPAIYVASTAAVLIALLVDRAIPGLAIVALGAAANLLAIVANGGFMPAAAGALAAVGRADTPGYSNGVVAAHPALEPLTDIFALPAWLPLANVFSVGDVLIGVGIVATIAIAMRARRGGPER